MDGPEVDIDPLSGFFLWFLCISSSAAADVSQTGDIYPDKAVAMHNLQG
jgi:hypothetical protein